MELDEADQEPANSDQIATKKRCRTCLKPEPIILINIFNLFKSSISIAVALQQFTNLEISADDPLPDQICSNCLDKLEDIYEFKDLVEQSDARLKDELKTELITRKRKSKNEAKTKITAAPLPTANIKQELVEQHDDSEMARNRQPEIVKIESNCNDRDDVFNSDESMLEDNIDEADDGDENENLVGAISTEKKSQKVGRRKRSKITFSCLECDKTYSNYWNLKRHMCSHTGVYPLKCDVCNKGLTSRGALQIHRLTHLDQDKARCSVCSKYFRTPQILEIHKQLVHDKTSPKTTYKCEKCAKSFPNKVSFETHLRRHTNGIEGIDLFTCEICGKDYASKHILKTHQTTHGPAVEKPCPICKKLYRAKNALRTHIRNVHPKEGPFRCVVCQREYKTLSNLKTHQKAHNREYKCEVCGKTFSVLRGLTIHSRVHTGETPYACKYCEKKYASPHAVMVHLKKKHPEGLVDL